MLFRSVCDGGTPELCDQGKIYINITPVNDLPIAENDSTTTNQGNPVSGSVADNDILSGDGGNVWSLVGANGGAKNGTIIFNTDGSYTYTPDPVFSGRDTVYYKLCDVDNDCDDAILIIKVLCATPSEAIVSITQPKIGRAHV